MWFVLTLVLSVSSFALGRYHEKTRFDRSIDSAGSLRISNIQHLEPVRFVDFSTCSALISLVCAIIATISLATDYWITGTASIVSNASIDLKDSSINYGLFEGYLTRRTVETPSTYKIYLTCIADKNVCMWSCKNNIGLRKQELINLLRNESTDFSCPLASSLRNGFFKDTETNKTDIYVEKFLNTGMFMSTIVAICIVMTTLYGCFILAAVNCYMSPAITYLNIQRYIAHKDAADDMCYLEKIKYNGENNLPARKSSTIFYPSSLALTKLEAWKLAGGKIVDFCGDSTIKVLEEIQSKSPDTEDPFFNEIPLDPNDIFQKRVKDVVLTPLLARAKRQDMLEKREASLHWGRKKRLACLHCGRKKRQVAQPGRFQGQTQSQYLNFGKDDQHEGKAEAEASNQSSRAAVSGKNGMGQAQSMSSGGSCEDCPIYPGTVRPYPATSIPGQQPGGQISMPGQYPGQQPRGPPGGQIPGISFSGQQPGGQIAIPGQYPGGMVPGQMPGGQIFIPGQYPGTLIPGQQPVGPPGGQMMIPGQFPGGSIPGQQPGQIIGPGQFPGGLVPGQQPGGQVYIPGQYPSGYIPGGPGTIPGQYPGGMIPGQQPVGPPGGQVTIPGQYPGSLVPGQQPGQFPGGIIPGQQPGGQVMMPGQFPGGVIPGQQPMGPPGGQVTIPGQYPGGTIPGGQVLIPGQYPGGVIPGQQPGGQVTIPGQYPGSLVPGQQPGQFPGGIIPGQQPGGQVMIPGQFPGGVIPGQQPMGPPGGQVTIPGQYPGGTIQGGQVSIPGQYPGGVVPGQQPVGPPGGQVSIPGQYPGSLVPGQQPGQFPGGVIPGQQPGGQVMIPGQFPGGVIPGQHPIGPPGGQVTIPGQYPGSLVPGQQPGGQVMIPGQFPGGVIPGQQPGQYPGSLVPGQQPGGQVMIPGQFPGGVIPGQQPVGPPGGQVTIPGQYPGSLIPGGQVTIPGQFPGGVIPAQQPVGPPGGQVTIPGQYPGGLIPGGQVTIPGQYPGSLVPGQQPGGQVMIPGQFPGGVIPGQQPGQYSGSLVPGQQPGQYPGSLVPGQQPGQYPGSLVPGQQPGGQVMIPGQFPGGVIPGQQFPVTQIPGQYVPGTPPPGTYVPTYIPGQAIPGVFVPGSYPGYTVPPPGIPAVEEEADSHATSSVKQTDSGTHASASADGKYGSGTAQSQVSGVYTGSGSFAAQAGMSDTNKGVQTQVSGGKEGALSSAQGVGGKAKSQAQVELNSETGATTTGAQTSGQNHGTSSQVQASPKGGMADAQANGEGSTSSQAQIGFQPYNKSTDKEKSSSSPFKGGGTASAQSGNHRGQSQSQIQGSFQYGITYTGAAQAGSGSGAAARQPFNFSNPNSDFFKSFQPPADQIGTTSLPELSTEANRLNLNTHSSRKMVIARLSNKPSNKLGEDTELAASHDEYDDEADNDDEDDEEEDDEMTDEDYESMHSMDTHEKLEMRSSRTRKIPSISFDNIKRLEPTLRPSRPKLGDVLEPNTSLPGFTIPPGFRGRVTSVSGAERATEAEKRRQTDTSSNISSQKNRTYSEKLGMPEMRALKSDQSHHDNYYGTREYVRSPIKTNYYTVTNSVAGKIGDSQKKFEHRYYTKSSTCGYFTFSCNVVHGSNGRTKICKPKMPTYPDGTPMKC